MIAVPSGLAAQEGRESASAWAAAVVGDFLPSRAGGRPLDPGHARFSARDAVAFLHVPRRPDRRGRIQAETPMHVNEVAG